MLEFLTKDGNTCIIKFPDNMKINYIEETSNTLVCNFLVYEE